MIFPVAAHASGVRSLLYPRYCITTVFAIMQMPVHRGVWCRANTLAESLRRLAIFSSVKIPCPPACYVHVNSQYQRTSCDMSALQFTDAKEAPLFPRSPNRMHDRTVYYCSDTVLLGIAHSRAVRCSVRRVFLPQPRIGGVACRFEKALFGMASAGSCRNASSDATSSSYMKDNDEAVP